MKLDEVILFQIDRTTKVAKQYTQREFDRLELGITVDQWVLLKVIDESGELSQRELAIKSNRDPASITRTLDLLEEKRLILRTPAPDSRRTYHISLSSGGVQLINRNMKMVNAHRAKSIEGFSNEETSVLLDMLIRIQKNMI